MTPSEFAGWGLTIFAAGIVFLLTVRFIEWAGKLERAADKILDVERGVTEEKLDG